MQSCFITLNYTFLLTLAKIYNGFLQKCLQKCFQKENVPEHSRILVQLSVNSQVGSINWVNSHDLFTGCIE